MKQFFDASSEIEYLTKCAVYDFAEQWTAGFSRHYFSRASARERATAQAEACAPQCRLKPALCRKRVSPVGARFIAPKLVWRDLRPAPQI